VTRIGRLSSVQARALLGTLNSPFNRSRAVPPGILDSSELALARDVAPAQMIAAPELAPVARTDPFENPASFPIRDELKYCNFNNVQLSVGAASARVLLAPRVLTRRTYLFLVNSHATQTFFVAFGQDSTTTLGVPVQPNFGFLEYNSVVPQDDIYLIASGAATTGMLVYSNASINIQK
jgi:hypothetical protein